MMNSIPETHRDLLNKPSIWHVATVGPNGEPQASPVWADYDGTYIRFPHKIGRQKWRNLNKNNKIALSATDPENPERYLEIRGTLVEWETEGAVEFLDQMAQKYWGKDEFPREHVGRLEDRITAVVKPEYCTTMG